MDKLNKIKKKNCAICGKEFLIEYFFNHNKKTCSQNCAHELSKQITKKNYEKRKEIVKIKKCKNCGNDFKSTTAYNRVFCDTVCLIQYQSKNRKGKNNPNYKDGVASQKKYGGKRDYFSPLHFRVCAKYRNDFLEKHGYLFCENCGINGNGSAKFETHHIVFASEAPKHKELHNEKNLILVCIKCHNIFHGKKREERKELVKNRGLEELFNKNLIDK